jgi:Large polyvalent protein associated domain 29
MNTKFICATEVAKLLRKALKETFTNIKFSVVTSNCSGGASIDVRWIDGPSVSQVKCVTDPFEGAYFDGNSDYQGYNQHKLDGIDVLFGAQYISVTRCYSDEMVTKAITNVVQIFGGCESISLEDFRQGRTYRWMNAGGCDMWHELSAYLYEMPDRGTVKASPTLARVTFVSGRESQRNR